MEVGSGNMEMHQIRYFLAVCETLNFTRAAEQCHVTQPALTRGIKKLEQELGGPLLRRERNLTHLTELGQAMRPYLTQTLATVSAAKAAADGLQNLNDAPLNLGIMCTIGPSRLIELMSKFFNELPGVELSLFEAVPDRLIDRLMQGELEVALFGLPSELPDRLERRKLFSERYVVAFPPGHRFERQNTVSLRDMQGEPYLVRLNCEYSDYIGKLLTEQEISLDIRYRSEREDWIQSMILAGMGCTFMPEYLPMHPNLPRRLITAPEITRDIELVTVRGRQFSPAVAAFIRMAGTISWSG
jgi:DNA-binding transcriptional LysR family regulator